jgi:gamma-glutamyl hercynylcysteine S-oxide synthase
MTQHCQTTPAPDALSAWVQDARSRTLRLVADLNDDQLMGPQLVTVNPLLWEVGHVAWFQEKWVLRRNGQSSVRADADSLYDSAAIPHEVRWDLPLPSRADTLSYMQRVQDRVLDRVHHDLYEPDAYFIQLAVFHEDMHVEAFAISRQTLNYPGPVLGSPPAASHTPRVALGSEGLMPGDVHISEATYLLGATRDQGFVFDNEKWAHPVEIAPYAIARVPVTQADFARFVADSGYLRQDLWSAAGWTWRTERRAEHPVYWRQTPDGWQRRSFDRWVPLEPHRPMIHANWYEAEAWCSWAGRRLPTEAEWELAASGIEKRRYPWGEVAPEEFHANLGAWRLECLDVSSCPAGESPFGCRQMIGNAWEWTADDFLPYPGFVADPYKEYSEPWFGTHKVLRGGSWATPGRLIRNTWRNFYMPHRADMWAGFRTCALKD